MKTLIKFIEEARKPVQIDVNPKTGDVFKTTDIEAPSDKNIPAKIRSKFFVPKNLKGKALAWLLDKLVRVTGGPKLTQPAPGEVPTAGTPLPRTASKTQQIPKSQEAPKAQSAVPKTKDANKVPGSRQTAPKTGGGGISSKQAAPTKTQTKPITNLDNLVNPPSSKNLPAPVQPKTQTQTLTTQPKPQTKTKPETQTQTQTLTTQPKPQTKTKPETQTQTQTKPKPPIPPTRRPPPPPPPRIVPPRGKGFLPFFWLRMPKPPARIGPRYGAPENLLRQPRSGKKDVTDR